MAEKVVDVMKFDRQAGESRLAETTLDVLRRKDAETDAERVEEVLGAWRAGGLGVAGPEASITALERGQVDELLIAASPLELKPVQTLPDDAAPVSAETSSPNPPDERQLQLAQELVTRAHASGARVRIIEDTALLQEHGGVAASLRFRI